MRTAESQVNGPIARPNVGSDQALQSGAGSSDQASSWITSGVSAGKISGMARTDKVTVSLPRELLRRIDDASAAAGASRSHTVAELVSAALRQLDETQREARYRDAYARQPETAEERDFIEATSADFFASANPWDEGDIGAPRRIVQTPRPIHVPDHPPADHPPADHPPAAAKPRRSPRGAR